MSLLVTFNGSNYIIPTTGEIGWGSNLDSYLVAIAAGCLQKTGGNFFLTAETDFGSSFGLKSLYLRSETINAANAGFIKMAPSDTISWRNVANNADLQLSIDSSDDLLFNGHVISTSGGVLEFPNGTVSSPGIASVSYSTTGIYIPSPNTLGFTTSGVLALSLDASQQPTFTGQNSTFSNSNNSSTILLVQNSNVGISAQSKLSVGNGTTSASLIQGGTGNTTTIFGLTFANYSQLVSSGTGLLINTLGASNLVVGTNSIKALTIDASQIATFVNAPVAPSIALTNTTNQLLLGTTRTVTLSATQPGVTSRTYTFPDLTGDYNLVGSGSGLNQTLQTAYTLTQQLKISATTNQFVLGTTNTTTITSPAPIASRTYTIPDTGTTSNFLLSGWGQIINADISASAAITYSKLTLTNSIVNGDIASAAAIAYSKLALSNSIVNGDINTSAAIAYSKLAILTTSRALQSNASTGFIEVSAVTNTELGYVSGVTSAIQTQLNAKAPIASPTFTGTVTAPNIALTDTSNQLVLGTTRTATITAPTPATASRTYTFPDLTTNYNVVADAGTQTIGGAKTFSSDILRSSSNVGAQNIIEVTNTDSTNAASSAVFEAVANGASAGDAFALYAIAGVTNWSTGIDNSDSDKYKLSASNTLGTSDALVLDISGNATLTGALTINPTTLQIILGTTRTVTITAPTPATTSRTWTIPDITGNGTFVALEGTQTFSGSKTFSSSVALTNASTGFNHTVTATGTVNDIIHNDGTSSTSNAELDLQVPSSTGGDGVIIYTVDGTSWAMGSDNSNNNNFKVSRAAILGTNDDIIIDTTTDGVSIKGTNTNTSPSAGYVGEVISSTVSTPTNDGGNDVWSDLTSISLSAGHWMISGQMDFILGSGASITQHNIGISTTSGNSSTGLTVGDTRLLTVPATSLTDTSCTLCNIEAKLTGTTIYYLKNKTEETSGNSQMRGRITAIRVS